LRTAEGHLIFADDNSKADGVTVLSFGQAQERAKKERPTVAGEHVGPYTVADAMDAYVKWLEETRRTAADSRDRDRASIRPALGSLEVAKLTTERLRRWLSDLATQPARLRTRKGEAQKHRDGADDGESKRRRQASANRIFTVLKAGLNR